jgi:SOS-response transcriptional repressor LexA
MTEALDRLREAVAEGGKPPLLTPFVGTGFSLAATGGADHASWRGLLLEGIKVCQRVGSPMPAGWPDRMREQLDNADVFTYLAVADEITRRLSSIRGGREFGFWLQSTVGRLEATKEGQKIIEAVCSLGRNVILTTNYDTVIEKAKHDWHPYTCEEPGYGSPPATEGAVLHLHGVAGNPDSIILSSAHYQRLSEEQLSQVFNQSHFASRRFVFIGCGDGLNDPNISTLAEFAHRVLGKRKREHYLLVPGGQLRQFNEHPISSSIVPVAYGSSFDELTPFLQKLVAEEEIDTSQDPDEYDRRAAARPRTALLDLAAPAWEKLQSAQDALRRAIRRMEQVENRGAAPDRMTGWDYRDQKSVHAQLASSVRGPATHLESCLVEVVSGFKDAERDVGRLLGPQFTKFAADLEQMIDTVSELETQTWQLRGRVAAVRDDLEERSERYGDYRLARDALIRAHDFVENAHEIARSLKDGLDQLRADAAGRPPTARPAEQEADGTAVAARPDGAARPDLWVVGGTAQTELSGKAELDVPPAADAPAPQPGEAAETRFLRVPLLADIAAGDFMLADAENVREYLALPAQYVQGDEVYLLEVIGDSMTGEDGVLEGDYIIVNRGLAWNNGDMVVVFVEGKGATLKRIWHDGTSIHLQPSNPALDPMTLGPSDDPHIQGKVTGVFRRQISPAHRRPRPLQ